MKDGGPSRLSMDFDVEIEATLSSARVNRRPTNDSALAALILCSPTILQRLFTTSRFKKTHRKEREKLFRKVQQPPDPSGSLFYEW